MRYVAKCLQLKAGLVLTGFQAKEEDRHTLVGGVLVKSISAHLVTMATTMSKLVVWHTSWSLCGNIKIIRLSVYPSYHLSVCPSYRLSVCLSSHLTGCLSVYPSYRLSLAGLSVYPSYHLSVYPSYHLSVCLSIHLIPSICLSIHLTICLSVYIHLTICLSVSTEMGHITGEERSSVWCSCNLHLDC